MCIGMATHLDRESTCTVIETNMVKLFGAYLAYFSLTNQSREVTCDFGFASGDDGGCGGWNSGDRDLLEITWTIIRSFIVIAGALSSVVMASMVFVFPCVAIVRDDVPKE